MRLAFAAVAALVTMSCRPEAAETRSASYASDRDRILRDMRSKLVMPLCKGDTEGYRACGLIVYEFREKAAQDKFSSDFCAGHSVREDQQCFELYADWFRREIARRYDQASERDVRVACAGEFDCSQWQQLELAHLQSHDDHVFAAAKRELAARGRQEDQDQATIADYDRQQKAWGAAFAGAAAGMQQGVGAGVCIDSYGCPMGHVCMVPSGSMNGTCMKPK